MNYILYIYAKLYISIYLNINYYLLLLLLVYYGNIKIKMQELTNIYDDIKQNIKLNQNLNNNPAFIYTGIGTHAGLKRNDGVLEPINYHQYPPIIQDLKKTFPNLNLFIVLIDPQQEFPPYMIKDKGLNITNAINPNIFIDEKKLISVYTFRQNVTLTPYIDPLEKDKDKDKDDTIIDITEEMRSLNKFAAENKNVTTLYHDFTGRYINLVAELFDEEIQSDDLDHIIYGLSAREDNGCYFDLTSLNSYLPFRLINEIENGINRISFFNIFQYIKNENCHLIEKDMKHYYPPYMHQMIMNQSKIVLETIKTEFKNHIFSKMRILLKLIRGEEKHEDIIKINFCVNVTQTKKIYIDEMFNERRYDELFDYLLDHYSTKIHVMAKISLMEWEGKDLIRFIINKNEKNLYNWYTNLDELIPTL